MIAQMHSQGPIKTGAIAITGPDGDTLVPIVDTSVSTHERLTSDMAADYTITAFDATLLDAVTIGLFGFRDPQIHLVTPATGILTGETVTFAPGTLRFDVTATMFVDGLPLFDGLPITAQYSNKTRATAVRGSNNSFHFVAVTFSNGEHTAVLHTEPSVLNAAPQ